MQLFFLCNNVQSSELIWAENDGDVSGIYHSEIKGGSIGVKKTLIESDGVNILPSISIDGNGNTTVVWSNIVVQNTILNYLIIKADGSKLGGLIQTGFSTNLAAVVIHDSFNTPWLFWSANNGGDDDIFVSRFIENNWTVPLLVHSKNNFVDMLPQAGMDSDGTVWVSWQQMNDGTYRKMIKTFNPTQASFTTEVESIDERILSENLVPQITFPANLNPSGRILLFRNNGKEVYNVTVELNR